MATVLDLESSGQLFRIDPALGPKEQEWRSIYVLPRLRKWLEETLPGLESTWNIEQTPAEQLDAFIEEFCAGRPLTFGWQFKPIRHIRDGIWQLKTADLRVFGWFQSKDTFIGSSANLADVIKRSGLYAGYRDEAVRSRDKLDLNEPKFVPGDDPHVVISDCSFA